MGLITDIMGKKGDNFSALDSIPPDQKGLMFQVIDDDERKFSILKKVK